MGERRGSTTARTAQCTAPGHSARHARGARLCCGCRPGRGGVAAAAPGPRRVDARAPLPGRTGGVGSSRPCRMVRAPVGWSGAPGWNHSTTRSVWLTATLIAPAGAAATSGVRPGARAGGSRWRRQRGRRAGKAAGSRRDAPPGALRRPCTHTAACLGSGWQAGAAAGGVPHACRPPGAGAASPIGRGLSAWSWSNKSVAEKNSPRLPQV